MAIDYCVIETDSSPTPGEVVQYGTVPDADSHDAVFGLFPGHVVLGILPPTEGDVYYDYWATPPNWHTRPDKPHPTSTWDYVTREWSDGNLDARRGAQWALIQAANVAADAEDLTWSGHSFQTDTLSRERMREAVLDSIIATLAGDPWSIDWTLTDNSTLTLSATAIAAVHRSLAARTDANHQRAQAKWAAIYASSTPEAITWTSTP